MRQMSFNEIVSPESDTKKKRFRGLSRFYKYVHPLSRCLRVVMYVLKVVQHILLKEWRSHKM